LNAAFGFIEPFPGLALFDRGQTALEFVVVFVLYTAYLPRLFGVLVHSTTYNRIVLRGEESGAGAACVFLLHKTPDEFVVWSAASRTVVWVPKTHLQSAEIRQGRPLFRKGSACD